MDIAAERNFGLPREARSGHIRTDLAATRDKAAGQKAFSPKGFAENGPATSLLLGHRSIKDMLPRRASSAGHSWRNSNIHNFLTGC
jgi:hypothetical protein